jgi:archaeal flagellar protein FlaJ
MVVPLSFSRKVSSRCRGLGFALAALIPGIRYDIEQTDLGMDAADYMSISLMNSIFLAAVFSSLIFALLRIVQGKAMQESLPAAIGIGAAIFMMFFFVSVRYPRILAGKKAEQLDRNLVFGLKDLLLQISSGVTLYNALINISHARYGLISDEFAKAAKHVKTGMPMIEALEGMALETKSEYLRRTVWQIVNTLKAGTSLKGALKVIIDELTLMQRTKIKSYAQELNLWSLIYMLFAVAVPTIGGTMLVILSSFAGVGVTPATFITFISICFIVQIILIGFVKTRRPIVNF